MLAFGNKNGSIQNEGKQWEEVCRRFSIGEIKSATNNLDEALKIGEGGFGTVYKGRIGKGATAVAIKRLASGSKQGEKEFWAEVKTLSNLHHNHLVPLIGYCNHRKHMFLVYQYMPHGTLADHLYKLKGTVTTYSPLTWEQRLNICIGVARGLAYLHSGTIQRFLHGDVKTTNILLDENWMPKIADFGLSRATTDDDTDISTAVVGTYGYMDPNYLLTNRLSSKSDVYSFGVVMLEVLCGRRTVDLQFKEEQRNLISWALDCTKDGKLNLIIDPCLKEQLSADCLKCFVQVVVKCLHLDPKERPTMAQVATSLELALMAQCHFKAQRRETIDKVFRGISVVSHEEIDRCLLRNWKYKGSECRASGEVHSNSERVSVLDSTIQSHTYSQFSVHEIPTTTYYFDEGLVIGQGGSSRVHRVFINGGPTKKASRRHGKNPVVKISEQQLQLMEDQQEYQRKHREDGLDIQTNGKSPPINSMNGVETRSQTNMGPNKLEEYSSNLDTTTGHKRSSNIERHSSSKIGDSVVLVDPASTERVSHLRVVVSDNAAASTATPRAMDCLGSESDVLDHETVISRKQGQEKIKHNTIIEDLNVSPVMVTTIQRKQIEPPEIGQELGARQPSLVSRLESITTEAVVPKQEETMSTAYNTVIHDEKSQTLEFNFEASYGRMTSLAKEPEERLEDNFQGSGTSTLTSSSSTSLIFEGDEGIKVLKSKDGVITLRDKSGVEVRLDMEKLAKIKKNILPQVLRIIEVKPRTFIRIGKLSSSFVKLIMEHFGGLLDLLERTVLKEARSNAFDEMFNMLEDLKRNMLNVEWLEDRVRAMSAQVKLDLVNSKLRLTTMKLAECEELLVKLKEKKQNLEIEARHLEKHPHLNFNMDGNAAQVLF